MSIIILVIVYFLIGIFVAARTLKVMTEDTGSMPVLETMLAAEVILLWPLIVSGVILFWSIRVINKVLP